jgi:hypothetical protein
LTKKGTLGETQIKKLVIYLEHIDQAKSNKNVHETMVTHLTPIIVPMKPHKTSDEFMVYRLDDLECQ